MQKRALIRRIGFFFSAGLAMIKLTAVGILLLLVLALILNYFDLTPRGWPRMDHHRSNTTNTSTPAQETTTPLTTAQHNEEHQLQR